MTQVVQNNPNNGTMCN